MAAASPSSSPDRRKKEKKKKQKKEEKSKKKPEKEEREGRRRKRSPSRESPPQRRARPEVEPDVAAPNFSASGLLDGPSGLLDGPPAKGAGDRSRSRDAQRPSLGPAAHPLDPFSDAGMGDRGKGKSDGKGKGKSDGKGKGKETEDPAEPKEEPNFEASGLLAVEDNSKNGIPLKFTIPADSRRPDRKWRLYIFSKQLKDGKIVHIHRQTGYLFGKDRRVVDVPTDHPTCSKQHAVLHFRLHSASGTVQPYIMDLESTNGTHINGERIEPARYYQVKEQDVLKFGLSSREHVLLAADSANDMEIDPKLLHHDSD